MKAAIFLLQAIVVLGFIYCVFYLPQTNSDGRTFDSAFIDEATTFNVANSAKTPLPTDQGKEPTPPEKPKDNPTEPSEPSAPEPEPEPEPQPKPESPTEPSNPEPEPEPSTNPKTPEEEELSAPTADDKNKGLEIDEQSLNRYPQLKEGGLYSRRKDQRRSMLCKLTHRNCIRYTPAQELEHFWMVCALYTPSQSATSILYELHHNFINYAKLFGFQIQVIEVVFPGQEFIATRPNQEPHELQYRADWIFNMRENLVNVGAKKLPADWEYISWIDAHIFWDQNRYFFEDVVVELGKNNIVHMLGSNDFYGENNKTHFYEDGVAKLWSQSHSTHLNPIRQCGMAWATRRDIFEATHGSLDVCIGTKCDLYQNYAYFGVVYTGECSNPEYAKAVRDWQTRAIQVYQKKVSYVKGNIIHFEHCYASRGCRTSNYDSMTQALMRHNFNPNTDMKRDNEGRMQFQNNFDLARELWRIYGGSPRLRRF